MGPWATCPRGSPALPGGSGQDGGGHPRSGFQGPRSVSLYCRLKSTPGPQPLFLEPPPQPSPSLPPPHCPPPNSLTRGLQVSASISLPSFKPPPQAQVSQGCLGRPLPGGRGDPDDSGTLPPLPIFKQLLGQATQENRRVFCLRVHYNFINQILRRGKKSALPTLPPHCPPLHSHFLPFIISYDAPQTTSWTGDPC